MKKFIRRYFALVLLCMAQPAFAAGCEVSSMPLTFGTISARVSGHVDTQGMLSLACTGAIGATVVYRISLTSGSSAGFNPRTLRSASGHARYNVYRDSDRNRIWGDGSAGTFTESGSLSLIGGLTQRNVPVYGRVFGGQSLPPGAYVDSLMITLSF